MEEEEQHQIYWYVSDILEDPEVIQPPEEVIPYLAWRERVTLFAAREKSGKSTLASAAASAASRGSDFLGEPCGSPKVVLWISFEEHVSEIVNRFVRFEADPHRVAVTINPPNIRETIPEICSEVAPDVIIWDSLAATADVWFDRPPDPNASSQWIRFLRWITEVTRACEAASIVLHHARKSDGKYRDSTAIGGGVDMISTMEGEGSKPRILKAIGRWAVEDVKFTLKDDGFCVLEKEANMETAILSFVKSNPRCSDRELLKAVTGRDDLIRQIRDRLLEQKRILNEGGAGRNAYVLGRTLWVPKS